LPLADFFTSYSTADGQSATFYQDKTIRIVAGTTTGGTYDHWARMFARTMPKYIPGNPNMLVQNMPGAGSMVGGKLSLYGSQARRLDHRHVPKQLVPRRVGRGRKEAQFKMVNFNWIGTQEKDPMMHYIRADAPYKSIEAIIKAKEPPKCSNSGTTDLTLYHDEDIGGDLGSEVCPGYRLSRRHRGGPRVEKGEAVCRTTRMAVHFSREPFLTWDKTGFDRHLLQGGMKRDSRAPDVPTIYELMDKYKTPEVSRGAAQVLLVGDDFGRPMVAPPGTPPDKVKIFATHMRGRCGMPNS
jgi:hypothetical protein